MKKPSAEKIERMHAKRRSRVVKDHRKRAAAAVEPLLLVGIVAFGFVIGLMLGAALVLMIL